MKYSEQKYLSVYRAHIIAVMLLLAMLVFLNPAMSQGDGGVETTTSKKLTGTAASGDLQPLNAGISAPLPYTTTSNEQSKKIQNIITLSLIEETPYYLGTNFTASVQVRIDYGTSSSSYTSIIQTLTVTYTKEDGAKYNAKNYFTFNDAEYVNITVLQEPVITPANIGNFNPKEILLLQNEMRVIRYFQLNSSITLPTLSSTSVANPADAFTAIWPLWPADAGNNATQLEWTWLETELAPDYYIPNTTQVDIEKLFSNNATRIDLPPDQVQFKIPLFYDGPGNLYYRIRAVNVHSSGSRMDGQWTAPGIAGYAGHNNDLNWQVRSSFAEEGKMKSVIEYYDGSLRSRQTVTKENVNNTTVAAETFYDYEGRPAIQILPTPSISTIVGYTKNLNLFNGQALNQNPADIFDLQPIASASSLTAPLSAALNNTGSAKYYSAANDELNTGANKNIPDAEGYPYTATRYTPDGTGRIMAQSGVGPAHKMSSGREIKYFYGSAAQVELDGLFGTEVGNFTHYFKNMVKDANGQMSVSYTDMHGRTIATALAGDTPGNLLALDINNAAHYSNQAGNSITRNLLDLNTNIEKNNSIESINTLLVPATTTYSFQYNLAPDKLQLASCTPTPLCYDCLYDLEISITDESGETAPLLWKFSNVSLNPDDDCTTATPAFTLVSGAGVTINGNTISFAQSLLPGSYSVRKTLTISEASLQKYKTMFFTTGKGICKTEQEIIDSVYSVLLTTSDCNTPPSAPCQSCRDQLGTSEDFQAAYLISLGNPPLTPTLQAEITAAYNSANENCNRICNETSQTLSSKRQLMLADMMPYGGQYASENPLDPLVLGSGISMYNKYNIFSTGNSGQPFYKNPWNANKQLNYYRNDIDEVDQAIHPGGTDYSLLNNTTKQDFTQQFVNSWANALLPHHPEYDRLVYAETTLNGSYNWINTFNATNTYAAAATAGYIMISNATIADPFYTVAPASYKNDMTTWITSNYAGSNLSLWQIARGDVRCKNITNTTQRQDCYNNYGGIKVPPFSDVISTTDKDQMWTVFRNLYSAARESQVNKFIAAQQPLPSGDETALINQGYQLRFANDNNTATQFGWTWYPSTLGGTPVLPPGFPQNSILENYTSNCNSYIDQWKRSLLQCGALASMTNTVLRDQILNEITTAMAAVCVKGSDAANPYGSSTVKPSTPVDGSPRSFEEIINQVYTSYGITPPKDYNCNPYVIEFPKPYGKNPVFVKEYTAVIDSCACARFSILSAEATSAGKNPFILSSINQYLQSTYQDTLTAVLHQALLNCSSYTMQVCDTIQELRIVSCYDPEPCINNCANRPANKESNNSVTTQSCTPPTTLAQFTATIISFYDCYGNNSLPNYSPACQTNFLSHFNSIHCTSYSNWSSLESFYQSLGGSALNVCTPCSTFVYCPVEVNCRSVFAPFYLSVPQPLPDFLKCGFTPGKCLTCDSMTVYTAEFKTIFSSPYKDGPVFTGTNLTPEQIQQNILYSRFLNFRTGYQYNWLEYAQAAAIANCNLSGGGGGGGVVDLVVTTRTGNTPAQYIASNSITFDPNFESGVSDLFETLLQPNGGGSGGPQTVICRDNKPLNDTTGIFVTDTMCHRVHTMAIELGQTIYQQQLITLQANFERQYRAKCMAAKNSESFTVQYTNKEYHYTLYYYDQAGSLVKTVPPKGVHPQYDATFLTNVKNARDNCRDNDICNAPVVPAHTFITQYRYNSLGQVITQNSPDAGTSKFWYDRLGRLVVSQNAEQTTNNQYSYTLYDALGRITEVGQKPQATAMSQTISQDDVALNDWIITNGNTREQITYTAYDLPYLFDPPNPSGLYPLLTQQNLRNRVSFTATKNLATDPMQYAATFYTYDIHGNVDTLLQDYKGVAEMESTSNRFKMMTYQYDLISGKVNTVSYQPDWFNTQTNAWVTNNDKFFHKYKYDAENRLTEALTSRDKIVWERDAAYNYYKHGPLARTVIGQQQVQGVDYAYTIQGWLKGVNGTTVGEGNADMGADGLIGGTNSIVARDVYGFGLHYFDNGSTEMDYKPIGVQIPLAGSGGIAFARPNNNAFVSLYNGNIAGMSVNNAGLLKGAAATTNALPLFYNYRYDQLNRIKSMNVYKGLNTANQWVPVPLSVSNDYGEAISYDPNGNIETYTRNATGTVTAPAGYTGGVPMDNMEYEYYPNTNRLKRVTDNVPANAWDNDINTQVNPNNYTYDAIGNLKTDFAEGITNINWTVYGKISEITKVNNGQTTTIRYTYDASGNRISKLVIPPAGGGGAATIYVRDASGNVMSIYEKPVGDAIAQTETHLYGSSRIGIANKLTVANSTVPLTGIYGTAIVSTFTRGEKNYELSNHLGNVLVTISDKKIQAEICNQFGCYLSYYTADVVSATDYYPFGLDMPGRKFGGAGRYGFNGKERDKEMNSLTAYDYGFRIYNPAIGKFLSVDPLAQSFPWNSTYAYAEGDVIRSIDLDGLEKLIVTTKLFYDDNNKIANIVQSVEEGNNKFGLGKGTLVNVVYAHEVEIMQRSGNPVVHSGKKLSFYAEDKGSWLGNLFRKWKNKFQIGLVVFGKGTGDDAIMGGRVGDNSEIVGVIDLNDKETKEMFEILDLIGKDRSKNMDDVTLEKLSEKIPDLVDKYRKAEMKELEKLEPNSNNTKSTPGQDKTIPRIEPGKVTPARKLPPIRRTDTVDQIPGTVPQYDGPWSDVRGGHTRDTIIDYIKRKN